MELHDVLITRLAALGDCELDVRELRRTLDAGYYIFFFNDPAPTDIYTAQYTLSLHDALPISEMIFAGFFFAEIGAETIFNAMRQTSKLEIYRQAFQNITRDETRHLVATMALLRAMAENFDIEQKLRITR